MLVVASNRGSQPLSQRLSKLHPRSEAKRNRIIEAATLHFAQHGYHAARVGDVAITLGIAKGSVFQHFGSKDGLFLEVYKRALRSFAKYLDAPTEVRQAGFFEVLRPLENIEQLLNPRFLCLRKFSLTPEEAGIKFGGKKYVLETFHHPVDDGDDHLYIQIGAQFMTLETEAHEVYRAIRILSDEKAVDLSLWFLRAEGRATAADLGAAPIDRSIYR